MAADNLPNAFHINSLLDLQKKLVVAKSVPATKSEQVTCPKHNDPLKVYCETCEKVICRDCTISTEHNTHKFYLVDECYPKHRQQIGTNLDHMKHKLADISTAIISFDIAEKEIATQEKQIQDQINAHAEEIIDRIKMSRASLCEQLSIMVQQKMQLLAAQRQQAQAVHTQLNTCNEMIEHNLKEWTEIQILAEKHTMINEMDSVTQHVDATVFQPIESANMKFTKTNIDADEIGLVTGISYDKATLEVPRVFLTAKQPSIATLALQSKDGSPFSLPSSVISSTLTSPGNVHSVKCDIIQTHQAGKYDISFTPSTRQDELLIQIGGVSIPDSPFDIDISASPETRGDPVNLFTGLIQPWGIAVDNDGDIVIAEYGKHCITILHNDGKKVRSFGSFGTNEGQFTRPCGVAVTNDGHILVTDEHRLQKLTTEGVCVKSVKKCDKVELNSPGGITIDAKTGDVYVADSENNCIQVFTSNLTFSYAIAPKGNKQLLNPHDVALDGKGYLYVTDYFNHCITKFTSKGKYITRFSQSGSAPGQLYFPSSLAIDKDLVYINDGGNNRVSIFDTKGNFLHCFGKRGTKEGEFKCPCGITIDSNGNLYVSDTYNNRIVVY